MQLTYMRNVCSAARDRCCARSRPQVTSAAVINKCLTRSSTHTFYSTADSNRSRNRRSVSVGLHSTTRAAEPASVAELLRHFVRCQHGFQLGSLRLPHWVGSPIKAAALHTKIPVEVIIEVHSPDWDADAYVSSQLSQMAPTGQHAARLPAVAAGSSSSAAETDRYTSGPLQAFATMYRANGETCVIGLKGRDIAGYARGEYDTVLQEQVGPASFILHLKPHSPDAPRQTARPVSLVGQGPDLQVAPGTIPEISCDVGVGVTQDKKRAQVSVVKPVVFSQLPGLRRSAVLKVNVNDPEGAQPDSCFTARMYCDKADMKYRIRMSGSHPLAAYAGRRVTRMALTPDGQLTLCLAPAAAAAAPNSKSGPAAGAAGGGAAKKRHR